MKYYINNIFVFDYYVLIIYVEFLVGNLYINVDDLYMGKGFYIGFGLEFRWKGLLYIFSFMVLVKSCVFFLVNCDKKLLYYFLDCLSKYVLVLLLRFNLTKIFYYKRL